MSNYNTLVRSPSFGSLGSCNISLGDDITYQSIDAALHLIGVTITEDDDDLSLPLPEKIVVDMASGGDDESVIQIDEPLEDLGVIKPMANPVEQSTGSFDDVFSTEEELSLSQELMDDQKPSFAGFENDIPSLMQGELLELETARPGIGIRVDNNDEEGYDVKYVIASPGRVQRSKAPPPPLPQDNTIARIVGYLHYTERDRHLVQRAEEVVRECHLQYQRGKKRKFRTNLNGAIFERLVGLMGGPRFNEVYHNSLSFDPSAYPGSQRYSAPPSCGQDTLQVAIAYGMHIARLNQMDAQGNGPEAQRRLVQKGVEGFSSMNVEERQMFWNYITKQSSA